MKLLKKEVVTRLYQSVGGELTHCIPLLEEKTEAGVQAVGGCKVQYRVVADPSGGRMMGRGSLMRRG